MGFFHVERGECEYIATLSPGIENADTGQAAVFIENNGNRLGDLLPVFSGRLGGESQLFVGDSAVVGFYLGFDVEQFLFLEEELFQQRFQRIVSCVSCGPYAAILINVCVVLLIEHHMSFLRSVVSAPPEGVFTIFDKMNLPADAALVGVIVDEQVVIVCGHKGFQSARNPFRSYFGFRLCFGLRWNCGRCIIRSSFLCRIRQQAHRHERNGDDAQQADPEAGTAVAQHGFDPVLHADLPEGHGAGGEVGTIGGTAQEGCRIALAFLQIHELHHPLIAGQLHVLAHKNIGNPHQGIKPVERQRKEADHLEPVVALFQMGALVGKDVLAHRRA